MNEMKQIVLSLVVAVTFAFAADAGNRPISYSDLPAAARTFLESNFPGKDVAYAAVDDDLVRPDYMVTFKDGMKIQFEHSGRLEKIESGSSLIPERIIPVQICDYVRTHYPDAKVTEYEVGRRDYDIKLSNRMELKFNRHFSLVEIDD